MGWGGTGKGWNPGFPSGPGFGGPGFGSPGLGGPGYGGGGWAGMAAYGGKGGHGTDWGGDWQKGGYPRKGGGGGPSRGPALPDGFEVNTEVRYSGKVSFYRKWSGYGFLEPDQKGLIPEDKLFVHWRSITSGDRFPSLNQDMTVEFGLEIADAGVKRTLRAKNVTLPGGGQILLQDEFDATKKEFVGGQNLRYTGTLKFYYPEQGYGYVQIEEGYQLPPEVPKELRIEQAEVNAGGKQPCHMKDIPGEFGIWKTQKGQFKVYNMTLPGGVVASQEALENRQMVANVQFTGTVTLWNWRQGWGMVQVNDPASLPAHVTAKIAAMQESTKARGKNITAENVLYFRRSDVTAGTSPEKETLVTFLVYTDDKGAGACELTQRV